MQSHTVRFENARGMTVEGSLTHPDGVVHDDPAEQVPAAILCHSFTAHKDIPLLKAMAEELADRGIIVLRFDFTDSVGASEGDPADMTLTGHVHDLLDALSWLESRGEVDPDRIGVGGHSLGGTTAVLAAASDDRPEALVPVSAPHTPRGDDLMTPDEVRRWRETGSTAFTTWEGRTVELGWQLYEDLQRYDARDAVMNVHAPVRFVHGSGDDVVPVAEAEAMYDRANVPKDIHIVDGADHLFRRAEHRREMAGTSADWFVEYL